MFSHMFVGDFDRAYAFYAAVMESLGSAQRFCEPGNAWAGWHSADGTRPLRGAAWRQTPYHDHYYGAYFRDPDGNKLCVACHVP
ncbi:MAG: hypothetical protein ABIZ09_08865 [Rhodoferax sp.]